MPANSPKPSGQSVEYPGSRMRWVINGEDPAAAQDTDNYIFHEREGIITRPGSQVLQDGVGGYGIFSYVYVNSQGSLSKETLIVDDNLHSVEEGTFSISYTGSNSNTYATIYGDGSSLFLDLYDNGSRVLNKDLGIGYNETTPVDMAALKVSVDAVADFSATITGETTVPAAYLQRLPVDLGGMSSGSSSVSVSFKYTSQISTPSNDPFSTYLDLINTVDFENVSAVNHKNCLYLAFPGAELPLYKYDSQSVYRAGLPAPSLPIGITKTASGSISGGVRYFTTYIYTDAVGNVVESAGSPITDELELDSENVNLSLDSLISSSGYNTNAAKAMGAQSVAPTAGVVTLSVDDGVGGAHSLIVGDSAYLLNRATGVYTNYQVSTVTANTVGLTSTETIQVSDNDVISANLKIAIYRTQTGGSNFYLVAEIPNDPFQDRTTYTDSTADVSALGLWVEPLKTQSPPPEAVNYVENVGDNLFLAKNNIVHYSDESNIWGSSEVFPVDDNQQTVYSTRGGKISGMSSGSKNTADVSSNVLYVFGEEFIRGLVGDFILDNYAEVEISDRYGCMSHSSITKLGQSTVFMSKTGVRVLTNGTLEDDPLSKDIDPYFTTTRLRSKDKLRLKRSVSVYNSDKDWLLIFVPKEGTSVNTFATDESETLLYDLQKKSWLKWKGIDMSGGAVLIDGELLFSDRSLIASGKLHKMQSSGYGVDYLDHEKGIVQMYRTEWEMLGKAKPRWIRPFCILIDDIDHIADFALSIKTYRDYLPAAVHSDISITRTGVGNSWGSSMPWGQSFGSHLEVSPKRRLRNGKATSLQVLFESTATGAPMILSKWQIFYATPYRLDGGMKE